MRTFISFPVPEQVKTKLKNLQEKIRTNNKEINVKWTRPDKMHITLKFIGEIEESELKKLSKLLESSAEHITDNLEYSFFKLDAFPDKENPRVIIVKLKENGRAGFDLEQNLRSYLKKYDFPFDRKKWIPHITIGRIKDNDSNIYFPNANLDLNFEVSEVHIKKSKLGSKGPSYETLETIKF